MWFGVTALAVLVVVFAIQRVPSAERIEVPKPTLQDRLDSVEPMKKQDRIIRAVPIVRADPTPVKTERIVAQEPPSMAIAAAAPLPVSEPVEEEAPRPRTKRRVAVTHHAATRGDVCRRHNMRKVMVGKYRWRCRR